MRPVLDDARKQTAIAMRAHGSTLREIADKMGCAVDTIARFIKQEETQHAISRYSEVVRANELARLVRTATLFDERYEGTLRSGDAKDIDAITRAENSRAKTRRLASGEDLRAMERAGGGVVVNLINYGSAPAPAQATVVEASSAPAALGGGE
jgi:hypothetical protein